MKPTMSAGSGARKTFPDALRARWQPFLQARTPRERRLLALLGAVLALALGYLIAWQPAADGSARLQTELPQLRARLAAVRADAAEAQRLARSPAVPRYGEAALRDAVERSLAERSLKARPAQSGGAGEGAVEAPRAGHVTLSVQLDDVAFAAVYDWLEALRTRGIAVAALKARTTGAAGRVSVRVVLDARAE